MNILGIDYGEKRIGLALADKTMKIATPFRVLENKDEGFVISEIQKIYEEENVSEIIIGMPITLKGEVESQAEKILEFIKLLKEKLNIPIKTEDERFTSAMVDKLVEKQKVQRDAVAAMLILQSYLDKQK